MALIYTRAAKQDDLLQIMQVLAEAIVFLRRTGSSQWQSGYPNQQAIQTDLALGTAYVLIINRKVAGYAAAVTGKDPNYARIAGGWANDAAPYTTFHRFALSNVYRGQHLASYFLANLISIKYAQGIRNFRVDTFRKNLPMQRLALTNGFKKRGVVQVKDPVDPNRWAYELNL